MPPQLLQERTSPLPNKLQQPHQHEQQQQQFSNSPRTVSEQGEYHPYLTSLCQSFGIKLHDANNTISCSDINLDSEQQPRDYSVQDPYFSSRLYKIGSRIVTLPDLPPFSFLNPFPLGRRALAYYRIVRDYARMVVTAKEFMSKGRMMDIGKHPIEWGNGRMVSLREFLEAGGYSHDFSSFFVPRIASVCTCSFEQMMEYPACVVLEYMARCMPFGRMMAIPSSSVQEIIEKLSENVGTVHYNTTMKYVRMEKNPNDESTDYVVLTDSFGVQRNFDHVIFATQANQAAAILAGYDDSKRNSKEGYDDVDHSVSPFESLRPEHPFYRQIKTLLKFPYERTKVVCHTDTSFLPKDPSHWRSINVVKPFSADVLASPISKMAKELEKEMELRSKVAKSHFTSLSQSTPLKASSPSILDKEPYSQNSVMTTYILAKTSDPGSSANLLQTINPIYPPRPETIVSSTWLDRVVVNSASAKAVDELQRLMEPQIAHRASISIEYSNQRQAPVITSNRVWFIGNYAYPGIPLLEGCVASAVRVAEKIIGSEPSRQLAVPSTAPVAPFWNRSTLLRERRQNLRRENVGRNGSKRQGSMTTIYFKTAWKDGLEDGWLEKNKRYVRPFTFNAVFEVAWILLLYLAAVVKCLLVFVIESFGGDGSRWAYT
ncbi:hypothetical protein BGZ80_000160 [Entomortierella chlamydospora]|uniref:Amine oxidase domain-containing protein n=1 Tax=Entomortierella chlamydospora TaxID=101097 RepID=A0A9P6SZ86_9FUNG|nr:hypothetical protein BGZ80_000160 [Entomortierella chlamydospora]